MPIPKPKAGEAQNDYVGRCMHAIADEYDTNEQAVAICISTFDRGQMSKITDTQSKVAAGINFNTKWKGINLFADRRCMWEGYEAIGTKTVDGREVPNCVPIKEE